MTSVKLLLKRKPWRVRPVRIWLMKPTGPELRTATRSSRKADLTRPKRRNRIRSGNRLTLLNADVSRKKNGRESKPSKRSDGSLKRQGNQGSQKRRKPPKSWRASLTLTA